MYEFILKEKFLTAMVALFISFFISFVTRGGKYWIRTVIYSYGPSFAAAFYIIAFFSHTRPNSFDLLAGLIFEISILVVFFMHFAKLIKYSAIVSHYDVRRILIISMVFNVIFFIPIISGTGFGLLSDGSRIDFIYTYDWAKHLVYANLMINFLQISFIAALLTQKGKLGLLGWLIILLNLSISISSGSKGAAILWIFAIISLINYQQADFSRVRVFLYVTVVLAATYISTSIVKRFTGLSYVEFVNIAISRFALNNDARALAFDLRTSASVDQGFFQNSFRSFASLFGSPPTDPPLGVLFFKERLQIFDGSGSNASFMALSTFYFPVGYSLIPALFGVLAVVIFSISCIYISRKIKSNAKTLILYSISMPVIILLSQDFLAFQLVLPIFVIVIFGMIFWQHGVRYVLSPGHPRIVRDVTHMVPYGLPERDNQI